MPKYTFDFDLDLWIKNLEIEADSLEEAKEKFFKMSVSDIIDEGFVKDMCITSLDIEEEVEE